ncbi:MAG: protoglobin domain-containing protein [Xanthobacteraceae bacterium]
MTTKRSADPPCLHSNGRSVRQRLRELRPLIKRVLPGVLDAFYAHVEKFPDTARPVSRQDPYAPRARSPAQHWS